VEGRIGRIVEGCAAYRFAATAARFRAAGSSIVPWVARIDRCGPSTLRPRITIDNRSASVDETWLGETIEPSKIDPITAAANARRA
jgi:hypothetical protein